MFNNYEELKAAALANANVEERARIMEEIALFHQRDWEEYALLMANCLAEWESRPILSKSVKDSYLIFKGLHPEKTDKLLHNEKAKDILFNDAFRLDVLVVSMNLSFVEDLRRIDKTLEEELLKTGLHYYQWMLPNNHPQSLGKELLVVSKEPLTEEEKSIIRNEKQESTPSEADALRKCLLITIEGRIGL